MSLAAPWALAGLLAVPLVWWWHYRRRRPIPQEVPSLLFFQPEPKARPARRRAIDPELWAAIAAAVLLALAAAGPRWLTRDAGRTVRVVVSAGAPAQARGYESRVGAALDAVRSVLAPGDRLDVLREPIDAGAVRPRPAPRALIQAAQAGTAGWRVVLSDRAAPEDLPSGVTWVAVGDAQAANVGIVSATLAPAASDFEVFVAIRQCGKPATPVRLRIDAGGDQVPRTVSLDLPPGPATVSRVLRLPARGARVTAALASVGGGEWVDDLPLDDRVIWEHRPLDVAWGEDLPAAVRRAVERALHAVLGPDGLRWGGPRIGLFVGANTDTVPASATVALVLHPAPPEAPTVACPAGPDAARSDPLVDDLSTAGTDLHYAAGAVPGTEMPGLLLWRESDGRRWPVVARDGARVHFVPDPLRGAPSPSESALWPVFIENLVRDVTGVRSDEGAAGLRRQGLLDSESTRLGGEATPLDPTPISALPFDRPAVYRTATPWLAGAALLCLVVLWLVRWGRPGRVRR